MGTAYRPKSKTLMKKTDQTKELLLEQLKKTPIVQVACEKIGITRMTFYRWKREDPVFTKKVEEAILEGCFLVNDLAESQLVGAVKDRNIPAIMYWLRHHHPAYANKLEVKHAIQDENLTPEQEALVREALRLASASQLEITNPNQQIYESQNTTSAGTGGGDDQGQESAGGNH